MVEGCRCKTNEISTDQWDKIDEIILKYQNKPGALIPVLEQVQGVYGYLPAPVQRRIADGLNISSSIVYGVVSFYSFFTMVPKGKHTIRVCMGTACFVKRSNEILEKFKKDLDVNVGEMTADGKFSLEAVRCVGACGLAPVVMINEDACGHINPANATEILKGYE